MIGTVIELRHLRTLLALHEAGSLTAAAEGLHVTHSALSHQLRELERQLGVAVVDRQARPLTLAPAGRRLLELAEAVLPAVRVAEGDIARIAAGHAARLHLGLECHSCVDWLLPVLDGYRAEHPEVALDLRLGDAFDPLPALSAGEVDAVIATDPTSRSDLHFEPLFAYRSVLVCARDHPLAEREHITAADLADETLITYPVDTCRLDVYRHFLEPAGYGRVARRTAELTVVILQLVASRVGVAVLPDWAVVGERDRYVTCELGPEGLWGVLWIAIRRADHPLPHIGDFLRIARKTAFATLTGIRPPPTERNRAG